MSRYELCPGCPAKYDGEGCCGHPTLVEDEPERPQLPTRYRITVYAGIKRVAEKTVNINPEDYDYDEKLIDDQLEELAEEYKAETTDVEWTPVG